MPGQNDEPLLEFSDHPAWLEWLSANHASSPGVWVKIAKKGAPRATITYAQAVDGALRYGWIDGQKGRVDDHFSKQRFTRRGPRSKWSQINREKADQMIASGAMEPPGLAQVQAARTDGRWDAAYPAQSKATVPEDLQAALDEHPRAKEFFETLTGSNRYAFLYRLHHVKRADARAKRIASYIELLSQSKTLLS
jgi:uncharacterized protein YdeI (YjbR/CyaY-like superfamily)